MNSLVTGAPYRAPCAADVDRQVGQTWRRSLRVFVHVMCYCESDPQAPVRGKRISHPPLRDSQIRSLLSCPTGSDRRLAERKRGGMGSRTRYKKAAFLELLYTYRKWRLEPQEGVQKCIRQASEFQGLPDDRRVWARPLLYVICYGIPTGRQPTPRAPAHVGTLLLPQMFYPTLHKLRNWAPSCGLPLNDRVHSGSPDGGSDTGGAL